MATDSLIVFQFCLVKNEFKKFGFQTPFDYAQGDGQTERSRSPLHLTKQHSIVLLNL